MDLKLEQPAHLNRYVDPNVPLTWAKRLNVWKCVLPLLVVCAAFMTEITLLTWWLEGRPILPNLLLLTGTVVGVITLPLVGLELSMRVDQKLPRQIMLGPKNVRLSHSSIRHLRWDRIRQWQLAPIPDAPNLTILTVYFTLTGSTKRARAWSMVLENPDQTNTFITALQSFTDSGVNRAQLLRLTKPETTTPHQIPLRTPISWALGYYLIMHGLAMVMVGFGMLQLRPDNLAAPRTSNHDQARDRIRAQFHSLEQLCGFLLVTGVGLMAAGGGIMVWGAKAKRARPPASETPDQSTSPAE